MDAQEQTVSSRRRSIFPPWFDDLVKISVAVGVFLTVYLVIVITYGFSPRTTDIGYMPRQPIPYSHRLHAGELDIDCRYCHNTVEYTAGALVPPTQTCVNCHAMVHPERESLAPLFASYQSGLPVEWVRVHDLSDFVYFNHSAHVRRGVGCVSCHGRVDNMEEVFQYATLSMSWCLDCHRNPEVHLRPYDKITDLAWTPGPEDPFDGRQFMIERGLLDSDGNPTWRLRRLEDCSTCHR